MRKKRSKKVTPKDPNQVFPWQSLSEDSSQRPANKKNANEQDLEEDLDLLTVAEVAAACRVHPKTVRERALRAFLQNSEN